MTSRHDSDSENADFGRFRKLVKRVISVPKSEIDRRAEEWKAARGTDKREESDK